MIPVEYFWFVLVLMFGIIGASRGLAKELGATTVLLLVLFALTFGWLQVGARISPAILKGPLSSQPVEVAKALYYIILIIFVAVISYEGFVLQFPVRSQRGLGKGAFGFLGGLLNGYLIIGTIWDVVNAAKYFGISTPNCGKMVEIASCLTNLHNTVVKFLPVTFIPWGVMLILGMILLVAIILK